jgi:hypothetical protein
VGGTTAVYGEKKRVFFLKKGGYYCYFYTDWRILSNSQEEKIR